MNPIIFISHKIYESLNKGEDFCYISHDASAAFDKKSWHDDLIFKLKCKGIKRKLLNWTKNYLTNQMQRVLINGEQLEWIFIKAAVSQGSLLGPLLFLI